MPPARPISSALLLLLLAPAASHRLHAASARCAGRAASGRCIGPRCSAAPDSRQKALIVGGGAAGLSCALELAERGWSVSVLSRDTSEGATLAAGGMLAPQAERLREGPLLDLCVRSRAHFGPWLRRLEGLSGIDVGLCARGGFLAPAFPGDAVHTWRPPERAGPAVWLGRDAVRNMEPALSSAVAGGWWYEREASVDPRAYHKALREACGAMGVQIQEGVSASSLKISAPLDPTASATASVITSDGMELTASAIILACGAWARELLPVPSFPIKGQMLRLVPPAGHAQLEAGGLQRTLFSASCYLIPRRDGSVVVGATEEPEAAYCRRPTAGGIASLLAAAIATAPTLEAYSVNETWAGLRPTTPDRMPLLGRALTASNLHVAAGYHRNGILLSPYCAALLADSIEGRLPEAEARLLGHFAVDRFVGATEASSREVLEGEARRTAAQPGGLAKPNGGWRSSALADEPESDSPRRSQRAAADARLPPAVSGSAGSPPSVSGTPSLGWLRRTFDRLGRLFSRRRGTARQIGGEGAVDGRYSEGREEGRDGEASVDWRTIPKPVPATAVAAYPTPQALGREPSAPSPAAPAFSPTPAVPAPSSRAAPPTPLPRPFSSAAAAPTPPVSAAPQPAAPAPPVSATPEPEWWNLLPKSPEEMAAGATAAAAVGDDVRFRSSLIARALAENQALRKSLAGDTGGGTASLDDWEGMGFGAGASGPAQDIALPQSGITKSPSTRARAAPPPPAAVRDASPPRAPPAPRPGSPLPHAGFDFYTGNSEDVGPTIDRALQANKEFRAKMQRGEIDEPMYRGGGTPARPPAPPMRAAGSSEDVGSTIDRALQANKEFRAKMQRGEIDEPMYRGEGTPARPPAPPMRAAGSSEDVGSTIDRALQANKEFGAKMQRGDIDEPLYQGGSRSTAGSATTLEGRAAAGGREVRGMEGGGQGLGGMAEEGGAAAGGKDDEIRLWKIEADGTRTPIRRGHPPPELLAGYGDTVLPPPVPDEAKNSAPAGAVSHRGKTSFSGQAPAHGEAGGAGLGAEQGLGEDQGATGSGVGDDAIRLWKIEADGTRTPIRRGHPPPELLAGYGDTVLPPPVLDEATAPRGAAGDKASTNGPPLSHALQTPAAPTSPSAAGRHDLSTLKERARKMQGSAGWLDPPSVSGLQPSSVSGNAGATGAADAWSVNEAVTARGPAVNRAAGEAVNGAVDGAVSRGVNGVRSGAENGAVNSALNGATSRGHSAQASFSAAAEAYGDASENAGRNHEESAEAATGSELSWQAAQRQSLARKAAARPRSAREEAEDVAAAEEFHSRADGYHSIMTGPADRNEALQRAYDENVQLKQAMGSESWEAMMEAEIEAELSAFRKEALLE